MKRLGLLGAAALFSSLIGCTAPGSDESVGPVTEALAPVPAEPGVIHVKAEDYSFTAPPTFPSGWVSVRFENQGAEPHFLSIMRLPEDRTFDEYASEIAAPFNDLYAEYRAGALDQAALFDQLVAALPEWFYSVQSPGGPGFTAAGRTSEATIHLEPGEYVMECYVRAMTQADTFHGKHGMLRPLIVTEEASGMAPPEADVDLGLSNYAIAVAGDLSAGPHVARVHVEEKPEGFVLHNAQLVRLEDGQTAAEAAAWLDWVDAMLPPAPAEFLGGARGMDAGRESYFAFDLEPGRYAWVSEAYGAQGMVHEFTVE